MKNPLQHVNRAATIALLVGSVCVLMVLAQMMVWALDRREPFELISYTANPTLAGDSVIVKAVVKRSLDRSCSVSYSRIFLDSSGARFDITQGSQLMNAIALSDLNRRTPDSLVLSITVPLGATPGVGVLVSILDYVCNPMHQLYPIEVLLSMDVEVIR